MLGEIHYPRLTFTAERSTPLSSAWKEKSMKLKKLAAIASCVGAVAGIALSAASAANATNMVNCAGRTDFYKVSTSANRQTCFANYGDYRTSLYDIRTISTGNNDGWVTAQTLQGIWFDSPYRPHWYKGSFAASTIVYTAHLR